MIIDAIFKCDKPFIGIIGLYPVIYILQAKLQKSCINIINNNFRKNIRNTKDLNCDSLTTLYTVEMKIRERNFEVTA